MNSSTSPVAEGVQPNSDSSAMSPNISDPAHTLRSILGDADMDMLRDCFIFLDHDGDGLVGPQTIGAVVLSAIGNDRYIGYEPYLLRIFEAADKDHDGYLSLIEFIECYAEGPGIVPQEVVAECVSGVRIRMSDDEVNVLQKVFFRLDTDEDGLLGFDELYQGLANVFGRTSPSEVISNAATLIIEAADRDGDGKLNVSDFILSFQYDQKVIPLELIEQKPDAILQNLTQQELFAIRQVIVPFLVEEDQRVALLNQYYQQQEGNQRFNPLPAGGLPFRPSSALQAPYGHLYVNLRTLLERALSTYCLLDDINAVTESILQSGTEVVVQPTEGSNASAASPTTEINIVDILSRVVDASAPYAEELYRQHQEQLLQQQMQQPVDASADTPPRAETIDTKTVQNVAHLPLVPAPLPHPHPKGQETLGNSITLKDGKFKGLPYPARSASEAEASPAAVAIAGAASASGNGPARRSRPSSAVGPSSTYSKAELSHDTHTKHAQPTTTAPAPQSRYAAYIHQTISSLEDSKVPKNATSNQAENIAVNQSQPPNLTPTALSDPPLDLPKSEHLQKAFIYLASDITLSPEGSAYVQRMSFEDVKQLTTAYLAETFPKWSNEQVAVATETLWLKAASLDSSNRGEKGYLTFDSFVSSYAVGGEVIGVTEDCNTFVVVNIGPLPPTIVAKIALNIPIAMNYMQRNAVRNALIRTLKDTNQRLVEDKSSISSSIPYVTTDASLTDLRHALAHALEPFSAFDNDESLQVGTLANRIMNVAMGSQTSTDVIPAAHLPLYTNGASGSSRPVFVNIIALANDLGITLPSNLPALVSRTESDLADPTQHEENHANGEHNMLFLNDQTNKQEEADAIQTSAVPIVNANSNGSVINHYQAYTAHLTPFELALVGAMFQRTAVQDVLTQEALHTMVTDIFIPPIESRSAALLNNEDLLEEARDKARRVTGAIVDVAEKDNAGRVKIAALAKRFEISPAVLQLGLKTSEGGVAAAVDWLPSCGLDNADLRLIAEHLVTIDRNKDGVVELTSTHRDLRRIVQRCHPSWDGHQLDRPALLILNTAILNQEGKITLQAVIRALAAEYYLTPEKHSKGHSGALSRRLDVSDLAKIRRAIESVPSSTPIDQQWEALRSALVEVAVVGDTASLTALLETTIDHLRQQKITTEKLAEKLRENPSALSFPIMLARDCHEVCLRKLKLTVPPEVIHVVCRTLLLIDQRGDGVLRRDEVDEELKRALTTSFGIRPSSSSPIRSQITNAAGSPIKMISRPQTANNGPHPSNSKNNTAITLTSDIIAELVRLIVLSQFEQVNINRFGKPLGQSATHANRNLEMNGFIELLVNAADGSLLPRSYLPSVEVPFKAPLGFDELEILKGAIESIHQDRRTSMTATELGHLLESAIAERRKPYVKIIGDVMLKLADGPDNSRFDLTELSRHFDITQNMLIFHPSQFSPLAADRVSGRIIRKEKVRKLARAFVAMDLNHDQKLDKTELMPHLLADAKRTVTEIALAKQMADARWSEIETLALQHNSGALPTAAQTRTPASVLKGPASDASNQTRVSLETFLATFCLGRFPAVSEMELDAVIKKASANTGGDADPNAVGSPANRQIMVNGGAAHRLLLGGSPTSSQKNSRKENAAGDYDRSGAAVRYDGEGANDNRSRYLSARNLSNVPIFDDELQQEFNRYDIDGNGYLNRQDFEKTYRLEFEYFGVRPSVAEVNAIFKSVCAEEDKVTFEEFCMLMLKRSKM